MSLSAASPVESAGRKNEPLPPALHTHQPRHAATQSCRCHPPCPGLGNAPLSVRRRDPTPRPGAPPPPRHVPRPSWRAVRGERRGAGRARPPA